MLLPDRARPGLGALIGILLSAAIGGAFLPFHDEVTRAVPALLLVVPVVLSTAIGGRRAGLVTVAAATLALSLTLPPVGSPRIRLSEDFVALVVFGAVAALTSGLVTTKIASMQSVDEQRRALLRSVSHDLRTPLATIRAVTTDMRDGAEYDDPTRNELLDVVIGETERLDHLVANLLSMSRIEAGALRPRLSSVDVAEVVDESVARVKRRAAQWPISTSIEDAVPPVRADHTQLTQVLDNLLDNAVGHTPPGTHVCVHARGSGDRVVIEVLDNGPGIADRFKASMGRIADVPTAGLGLAICSAIVEQHAGTIRIDEPPGGGTRVTIDLPRAA